MLNIVGIGPGNPAYMSVKAIETIKNSQVIVGYKVYTDLISNLTEGKEVITSSMTKEIERCKKAIEIAKTGKNVSIVCSGDPGVYAMSGLVYELLDKDNLLVEVIPGITASLGASAVLGAPLMHDFATISLSDLMTDINLINKRIELCSKADMVICIYNPRSSKRKDNLKNAVEIMLKYKSKETPVGIVKNIYRENQEVIITRLSEIDYEKVDMFSTVIVGNSTSYIENNKIITKRGYETKKER